MPVVTESSTTVAEHIKWRRPEANSANPFQIQIQLPPLSNLLDANPPSPLSSSPASPPTPTKPYPQASTQEKDKLFLINIQRLGLCSFGLTTSLSSSGDSELC
ncbi:hypothetical protein Pyn_28573 [Prunus yedoensis var. nudiflora]|uniref:Uncharacterized protein n=1 Tax=Prunus yedoensis var. nudiflora TaxID=2094558 RepID=A0A314YEE5_PRUYE|nr:hypothetical protein Pyn_28573 [Prunus yedoensis var. nudiflora]